MGRPRQGGPSVLDRTHDATQARGPLGPTVLGTAPEPPPQTPYVRRGSSLSRARVGKSLSPGTKMEPGTILSIVQLSGSILNLGSKVAKEFLGNDKVRDKLVNLNVRLQTFYKLVDDFVQDAPGAPSQLEYPGAGSIIKTLNECKGFLEQYDRTLSANRSLGGATQRAWLVLGPDGPKVEDFNNRINQHIQELHFWTSQIFQREFRST